jgi:hypothetical protein
LEDTGVFMKIILKCIIRKWDGDVDLIDLAQKRYGWRVLLNEVLNLRVLYNCDYLLTG